MTHSHMSRPSSELEPHARLAEQALRASERAEQVLQRARAAQRSAADSVQKSAESHERTAQSYERAAAQHSGRRDTYLARAARHREFAEVDYRMAERLRQMCEAPAS
jgi:flagellar biosynthesis/type III secretory pathway protein FliH